MRWILLPLLLFVLACKNEVQLPIVKTPEIGLITENAMVVSAREEASQIGVDILKKGGNAFDAMVATEMALALTYPNAGNLGGGGFIVYRTQYGELGAFDYREKAPMKASRDMFLDAEGNVIKDKSIIGGMAVGVPGTIAGIFAVHQKLGSLPIEELLAPVIELARKGYVITEKEAAILKEFGPIIEEVNEESSIFTNSMKPEIFLRMKPWQIPSPESPKMAAMSSTMAKLHKSWSILLDPKAGLLAWTIWLPTSRNYGILLFLNTKT